MNKYDKILSKYREKDVYPGGSDKQVQFNSGGTLAGDTALIWDNTNKRLGINTVSPSSRLHVAGHLSTDIINSDVGMNITPISAPATLTASVVAGSGLEIGNYYYHVTYYTALGETNVRSSGLVTTTAGNQKVDLTFPVSTNAAVIGRKIYRSTVGQTSDRGYLLTTIANNTATTYSDTTPDASLSGDSWAYYRPNTTSRGISVSGSRSLLIDGNTTVLGYQAGNSFTSAGLSTFIGSYAGYANTYGFANTALGYTSLRYNTTGGSNTALGYAALYDNLTGSYNVAVGEQTLANNVSGTSNTAVGGYALAGAHGSSLSGNTAIGLSAGYTVATGTNNVFLGYYAGRNASQKTDATNSIAIGANTYTSESNQAVYGDSNIAKHLFNAGRVGIGGISAPAGKLDIKGAGTSTGIAIQTQDSGGNVKFSVLDNGTVSTTSTATGSGSQSLASNLYIQSRGQNLMTNGYGLMGNNYNFTSCTFDQVEVFAGGGSFKKTGDSTSYFSDEKIPVDPNRYYQLSAWLKSTTYVAGNSGYLGIVPYDIDGNTIVPQFYGRNRLGITDTTLAVDLNPGDTTITLTDGTNWQSVTATASYRQLVWYPYTNAKGYTYPDYTYSRNVSMNNTGYNTNGLWASGGITGNVITLTAPWPFAALPAGTKVSNATSGGTYKYCTLAGKEIPNSWKYASGVIGSVITDGWPDRNNDFPPGTAFVSLLVLCNRLVTGNVTNISAVEFTDVTADNTLTRNRFWGAPVRDMTLSNGGSPVGTSNGAGGDLYIKSGISTGTGTSAIHLFTCPAGGAGTTDNTQAERLTILGSGNVGIGTTAPAGKLDIKGVGTTTGIALQTQDSGGAVKFTVLDSGNVEVVTNSTRVAIKLGTYSAVGSIYSSADYMCGNNVIPNETTTNGMVINRTHATIGGRAIRMGSSGGISFHTLSGSVTAGDAFTSERVRIDNSGNVGIATTAPSDTLDVLGTARFGDHTTNYSKFEADGTYVAVGTATTFDDLLGPAMSLKSTGIAVSENTTEQTIDFTTTATLTSYAYTNFQMTHKWKAGSSIYPHIHWEQAENNTPNWLLRYRWQRNNNTKTTTWTDYKCNTNSFTYTSGTLNQISYGAAVTAPAGYSISDIVEVRIFRDTANTSTLFSGADPYTTTVGMTSADIHIECDTLGSRTEYTK